jgi:hypothetical protein
VGSSQNLHAVSETEAGAGEGPGSERRVSAQATLLSLLEMAYGSREGAVVAAERALAVGACDSLPQDPGDMLVFVLGPLFSVLSAEIGPRLAKALVEDFTARFDAPPDSSPARPTSSAPPQSVPRAVARVSLRSRSSPPAAPDRRALLIDADRVGRATMARALMRERWGVRVVESIEDLADALGEATSDVMLVDAGHPSAAEMVRVFATAMPGALLVLRGPEGPRSSALLAEAGGGRAELLSRDLSAEELIDALRRVVG